MHRYLKAPSFYRIQKPIMHNVLVKTKGTISSQPQICDTFNNCAFTRSSLKVVSSLLGDQKPEYKAIFFS